MAVLYSQACAPSKGVVGAQTAGIDRPQGTATRYHHRLILQRTQVLCKVAPDNLAKDQVKHEAERTWGD